MYFFMLCSSQCICIQIYCWLCFVHLNGFAFKSFDHLLSSSFVTLDEFMFESLNHLSTFENALFCFYLIPQLVENVAICLIKIVERVRTYPEMLNELCKHGLIQQATHLIDLNSRTTLSQPIYTVGLSDIAFPNTLTLKWFSNFLILICRV